MAEDQKPKVYIVIYSLYHHIYKLATKVAEGVEANGCQVKIFQVEETLSPEILEKMHAPVKPDLPIITAAQLAEADGLLFGVPTRFGTPPAQIKRLLDATGSLWAKGTLSQKFAGFFFSTASSHGGQETTALTTVTYLAHHGINYVPFGFANASLFDNSKVIGGSAYGAGTISNGDGTRIPIEEELEMAKNQGENFAKLLVIYHRGMKLLAGLEKQPIHATDQTPATTTTATPAATSEAVGTKAGAIAAAAGGAGLVAAGTKAALQSDQGTAKQGTQTDPTAKRGATTTQSDPAVKQGATQSAPTAKQGATTTQSDTAANQAPTQGTTKSDPTARTMQGDPATKQGTVDGAKQGPASSQPKDKLEPTPPDSSTQPPNRPLTPQQEQAQQAQQHSTQPTQEKKKKSKGFWFCCGNSKDLD